MNIHEKYMQRCLQLAENGLGNTYPNPLVGSVIVYNDKIIGEGYHAKAGTPHAEINAINSVKNKNLLKKSTLYVNLEPCSHYGKTPPCAKKIADIQIPNVVIGTIDTTDKVAGKGIQIMRNAGINVTTGILEKESREINKRFFTFHEKKRPYIILKWAQTIDGFIDIERNANTDIQPYWITGTFERQLVHKWRAEEQAIMIGTNTAMNDNPALTTRLWHGNNPVRIVIDKKLKLDKNLKIFDNNAKTLVFNEVTNEQVNEHLKFVKISSKENFLKQIFSYLYSSEIQSVIIEGGKTLLQSCIDMSLWDESRIFYGKKHFKKGLKAPQLRNFEIIDEKIFKDSYLTIARNSNLTD